MKDGNVRSPDDGFAYDRRAVRTEEHTVERPPWAPADVDLAHPGVPRVYDFHSRRLLTGDDRTDAVPADHPHYAGAGRKR